MILDMCLIDTEYQRWWYISCIIILKMLMSSILSVSLDFENKY